VSFVTLLADVLAARGDADDHRHRDVEETLHRVMRVVHTAHAMQRMATNGNDNGDRFRHLADDILGHGFAEAALAAHVWTMAAPRRGPGVARPPPGYLVGLRRSGVLGILHVPTRLLLQLTPTSPHPTATVVTEEDARDALALTATLQQRSHPHQQHHRDPNVSSALPDPTLPTAVCRGFWLQELTGRILVNPHWKVEGTRDIFRSDEPQLPFLTLAQQGFRSRAGVAVTPGAAFLTAVRQVGRGQ
jgi:hypothetical protein